MSKLKKGARLSQGGGKKKVKLKRTKSKIDLSDYAVQIQDGQAYEDNVASPADFELLKVIGTGHYSSVYLGKKKDTGKYYGIKVMDKKKIIEGNDVRNIKTERKVLESFHHPYVVNLHYAFQTKRELFLVMDFVQAGEIFTHLKDQHRFKEERVRIYAAEIFLGLHFLHGRKMIYRDLKPENVLIASDGHIKLCDFGLSKILKNEKEKTNTWCGTPEYLAPEILLECDDRGYGQPIDWWAFGVLIYEMLIGITPFYNEDTNKMYENIIYEEILFPDRHVKISKSAKDLIKKLLVRDPDSRLGTEDENNIKRHRWFRGLNWKALDEKALKAPWMPKITGKDDLRYIDKEFLDIPVHMQRRMQEKEEKEIDKNEIKRIQENFDEGKKKKGKKDREKRFDDMFVSSSPPSEKEHFEGFEYVGPASLGTSVDSSTASASPGAKSKLHIDGNKKLMKRHMHQSQSAKTSLAGKASTGSKGSKKIRKVKSNVRLAKGKVKGKGKKLRKKK